MELACASWRKSSRSGAAGECVEVAFAPGTVGVRDSKNPGAGVILVPEPGWRAFTRGWLPGR
jgi:hypothetical protein